MSWAAGRECTRGEDHAYSLVGFSGIHMPLLYYKGLWNAFQRLQQEILKNSNDESIFAWDQIFDSEILQGHSLRIRGTSEAQEI
jgi:hypothetical protein